MHRREHCDVFTSERSICVTSGGVLALFGRTCISLEEADTYRDCLERGVGGGDL